MEYRDWLEVDEGLLEPSPSRAPPPTALLVSTRRLRHNTMARSFRHDLGVPPPRYRTPSPPLDAVEPNSPTFSSNNGSNELGITWASERKPYNKIKERRHCGDPEFARDRKLSTSSLTTMDTLASIAIATEANPILTHNAQLFNLRMEDPERVRQSHQEHPHKRSRSEKLPSPEVYRTGARPTTSYTQPSDITTSDAELLLGLWPQILSHTPNDAFVVHEVKPSDNVPSESTSVLHAACAQESNIDPSTDHGPIQFRETTQTHGFVTQGASTTPLPPLLDSDQQSATNHLPDCVDTSLAATITPEPVHLDDGGLSEVAGDAEIPRSCDLQSHNVEHRRMSLSGPPTHCRGPCNALGDFLDDVNVLTQEDVQHSEDDRPQNEPQPPEADVDSSALHGDGNSSVPPGASEMPMEKAPNKTLDDQESPVGGLSPRDIVDVTERQARHAHTQAVCAACNFTRNTLNAENETDATSWISCDGCKAWFHFACAGFKSEREVRSVDKYRCRKCRPSLGPTTYVRKSARAHSAIDYAGLNEGVIKTSDESPEHHYIKPIKDGTITFQPEAFPRMRPELVTAEYFEKGSGMKEPVVIPASWNPRPSLPATSASNESRKEEGDIEGSVAYEKPVMNKWFDCEDVPDHGQDALDMVIPQNLTVRRVAEMYGLEEKVEVIDVKSQNGEDKKWNMRRWADYYESRGSKIVRNVISLEVSQSKLGRLIRRPRIVRDLDLQDAVWPAELQAKIDFPKVQFYCLMSVADCFTDFHIDFGGSSVFYHILRGKKTFLFIPPKEKHLKKYEEWCMSPAQNWTFLADQTKECYRVDLSEGDTMLIPAGWIHAVWTPEDSLVIGGNFLTRMNYAMQIRISQIEKVTGVARKFRYPHFQKVLWYTALNYLEEDPLPLSVSQSFESGERFHREQPSFYDFDAWGHDSKPGEGNYHARYYSQAELEGLPDLTRYLLRTALIAIGSITEGITVETRNAVKRSIPKGHGEPLEIVKNFAKWCAWKRGNEPIPHWAYADHVPEGGAPETAEKRLSTAAVRRLDREAALQAYRVAPERQSARKQSQKQGATPDGVKAFSDSDVTSGIQQRDIPGVSGSLNPVTPISSVKTSHKRKSSAQSTDTSVIEKNGSAAKRRRITAGGAGSAGKGPACESCRKRRRACKHRDQPQLPLGATDDKVPIEPSITVNVQPPLNALSWQQPEGPFGNGAMQQRKRGINTGSDLPCASSELSWHSQYGSGAGKGILNQGIQQMLHVEIIRGGASTLHQSPASSGHTIVSSTIEGTKELPDSEKMVPGPLPQNPHLGSKSPDNRRSRSKACNECRKSKVCILRLPTALGTDENYQRRCIHDEYGNEDPIKLREAAMPRIAGTPKRRHTSGEGSGGLNPQKSKKSQGVQPDEPRESTYQNAPLAIPEAQRQAPLAVMVGPTVETASQHCHPFMQPPADGISGPGTQTTFQSNVVSHSNPAPPTEAPSVDLSYPTVETTSPNPQAALDYTLLEAADNLEDEVQLVATSPPRDLKLEVKFISDTHIPNQRFSHPPVSSFISPPASTHTDAEGSPPAPHASTTPSTLSSRHSSRQPRQVQRYTPESGSARRASSSTADGMTGRRTSTSTAGGGTTEKSASPMVVAVAAVTAREGSHKRSKPLVGPEDEDSMRLIKELQAQEYGLRRRGRI